MKDTLEYIIKQIVDNKDEASIAEEEVDGITNLTITVAQSDMGKIIGKEGKVIRGIRNVMKIKAMKQNTRINIQLAEQAE